MTTSTKVLSSTSTNSLGWELQIFIEKSGTDTPWGWQGLMEGLHESLADAKAHLATLVIPDGVEMRAYEKLSPKEVA